VCHTDLHYREGGINDDFPFLLGHEAAGIVESVGPDVTEVAPGDFVILNWRAVCGECRACLRGRPWYCFATHNATQKMTLDGTELSPALGIGAFAEKTLVAAGQCTKVDPSARPRRRPARLRRDGRPGCGHQHRRASAAATRVAVIGCGGVGDAAIMGARLAGARRRIIAVDLDPASWTGPGVRRHPHRQRLRGRPGRGHPGAHRRLRRRRGHRGGRQPRDLEQAFYARDLAGTVVLVGVPTPDMRSSCR
jgi:S-(hydroxymethyl)mycothiol dehydrogenase